jgi:hypothetical protein
VLTSSKPTQMLGGEAWLRDHQRCEHKHGEHTHGLRHGVSPTKKRNYAL